MTTQPPRENAAAGESVSNTSAAPSGAGTSTAPNAAAGGPHTGKHARADWSKVLDAEQIRRSIIRISHEILEKNRGAQSLAVVGIRTRGEFIAKRLVRQIAETEGREVPFGVVDITLYRDDIYQSAEQPIVRGTDLPFNVDKVSIILVDDVLFTGRTVRAALDAIIDFGRPHSVQLAALVDRGHRELPIRADYVGKSIPTSRTELVEVCLVEKDEEDAVYVYDRRTEQKK